MDPWKILHLFHENFCFENNPLYGIYFCKFPLYGITKYEYPNFHTCICISLWAHPCIVTIRVLYLELKIAPQQLGIMPYTPIIQHVRTSRLFSWCIRSSKSVYNFIIHRKNGWTNFIKCFRPCRFVGNTLNLSTIL